MSILPGSEILAWNAPIPVESASHSRPPFEPHVLLEERAGVGTLRFDVVAGSHTENMPFTNLAYGEQTVVQAHQGNDPNRGIDPYRIFILDNQEGIRMDEDGIRAVKQFWQTQGTGPVEYYDTPNHAGYVGMAQLGENIGNEYSMGGYSFVVSDHGLVLASLRVLANRAANQAGAVPTPPDIIVPRYGGWVRHPQNWQAKPPQQLRPPRHAADENTPDV